MKHSDDPGKKHDIAQNSKDQLIPWHPAFVEAIQMELNEYRKNLQFLSELPLNAEPLKIDVVIIKKSKDIPVKKNIAMIFRKDNIVEYKSPLDFVSIDDFYKVYAYACLYKVINKIDIQDITLSFVASRRPRELIAHLKKVCCFPVEEKGPGIYIIERDILPIQIIDSRKLSAEENIWLRGLDNRLGVADIRRVTSEISRQGKPAMIKAYLDAITKANIESLMEALKMSDTQLTLDKVFEEAGLVAKWEARGIAKGEARGIVKGEEQKASEIARNMLKKGFSVEETSQLSGLSIRKIRLLS